MTTKSTVATFCVHMVKDTHVFLFAKNTEEVKHTRKLTE